MKLLRQCNQLTATDQTFTPTGYGPKGGHIWLMKVVSILSGCSSQKQTNRPMEKETKFVVTRGRLQEGN